VLLELAYAWRTLGALQGLPTAANLGELGAAEQSYAKAIALAERAGSGRRKQSLTALTAYYAESARVHRAKQDGDQVRALLGKLEGATKALAAFGPSSDVATAYSELAYFHSLTDHKQGIAEYRQAIAEFERAPGADLKQKAFAQKRLGALLLAEKEVAQGAEQYRAALAIERRIGAAPFDISFTLSDLGLAARLQGRLPEALRHYQEALQIREAAYLADPSSMRTMNGLASTLSYLSWVHTDAGRMEEAVAHSRRSLEMRRKAAAASPENARLRTQAAWEQYYLAEFLRKQNAARNAGEIQGLLAGVRQALAKDPDAGLAAELEKLVSAGR
jgi:eukaryotic-like serine/threonine-protein kinase